MSAERDESERRMLVAVRKLTAPKKNGNTKWCYDYRQTAKGKEAQRRASAAWYARHQAEIKAKRVAIRPVPPNPPPQNQE